MLSLVGFMILSLAWASVGANRDSRSFGVVSFAGWDLAVALTGSRTLDKWLSSDAGF